MIGNAEEMQIISVVNLNSGKNKKVGTGVYNLDMRSSNLSKKKELFTLPKTASAITLSHQLAQNIEEKKEQGDKLETKSKADRQSLLSFRRDPLALVTPNSKIPKENEEQRKTPRQVDLVSMI